MSEHFSPFEQILWINRKFRFVDKDFVNSVCNIVRTLIRIWTDFKILIEHFGMRTNISKSQYDGDIYHIKRIVVRILNVFHMYVIRHTDTYRRNNLLFRIGTDLWSRSKFLLCVVQSISMSSDVSRISILEDVSVFIEHGKLIIVTHDEAQVSSLV